MYDGFVYLRCVWERESLYTTIYNNSIESCYCLFHFHLVFFFVADACYWCYWCCKLLFVTVLLLLFVCYLNLSTDFLFFPLSFSRSVLNDIFHFRRLIIFYMRSHHEKRSGYKKHIIHTHYQINNLVWFSCVFFFSFRPFEPILCAILLGARTDAVRFMVWNNESKNGIFSAMLLLLFFEFVY